MIPINAHNYETYFLLYADGELNADERQAVVQFVQANPDLAVELDLLLQLRLPADEALVFADKQRLLRNESAAISLQNCEEYFLLYVDHELDAERRQEVETFVLQHPEQQQAFTLLKQTRLTEEKISFPAKAALYRAEEKERPVFYLRWQRFAIAAAVLGAAVLVWTLVPSNNTPAPYTAGQNNTKALKAPAARTMQGVAATDRAANELTAIHHAHNTGIALPDEKNIPVQQAVSTSRSSTTPNTKIQVLPAPLQNNALVAQADPVVIPPRNTSEKPGPATREVTGNNALLTAMDREHTLATQNVLANNPSEETEMQPAVYRELDTESADQRKSLLLGSIEINKDKLRGFFRKAGSIFRSKARADEEVTPVTNTRSLE